MIGIIVALALAQQPPTVAVQVTPDGPTAVMLKSDAEREFKQLCADASDDRRLRALAAALNPMPDWAQLVMNGEASVCNRNPKAIVPVPLKGNE